MLKHLRLLRGTRVDPPVSIFFVPRFILLYIFKDINYYMEDLMARQKRIWYPGATYHVMSRGNRRTAIFQDRGDYLHFLEVTRIIKEKYPFKIHSLCLMTNHFHMAIETISTELWRIMQKVLSVYAEEFNHILEASYMSLEKTLF